jgi:dTDP-4-amino-4,6-dideoxygalactose transaminase
MDFNYLMTEFQCAFELLHLKQLKLLAELRNELATSYINHLDLNCLVLILPMLLRSWHLIIMRTPNVKLRRHLFIKMRNADVKVDFNYSPVYLQSYNLCVGLSKGYFSKRGAIL